MSEPNDPYDHDPRVAEIDARLEEIDAARRALKEEGRKLVAEKAVVMMREQVTLRVLNDSPLSAAELAWAEANPDEWAAVKEATRGKRGSRRPQRVTAK
jgi:hypothetical protein